MSESMRRGDLSFDEYSALRRRSRSNNSELDDGSTSLRHATDKSSPSAASPSSLSTDRKPFLSGLGDLVESVEVQMIVLLLSFIDIALCVLQLTAESGHLGDKSVAALTAEFVQYQVAFTLSIYVLELVCLAAVFRLRLVGHAGYVTDIFSLLVVVTNQVTTRNPAIRLVSVLRMWRVGRVVNTLLAAAHGEHDVTRRQLEQTKEELALAQMNSKRLEVLAARQEKRSDQMENSIQSQNEELDTLREALSIAAQTVARTGGYMLSDNEEEEVEHIHDHTGAEDEDVDVDHKTLLPIMSAYRASTASNSQQDKKARTEQQRQRLAKLSRDDDVMLSGSDADDEEAKLVDIDTTTSLSKGSSAEEDESESSADADGEEEDDDDAELMFTDAKPFAKLSDDMSIVGDGSMVVGAEGTAPSTAA